MGRRPLLTPADRRAVVLEALRAIGEWVTSFQLVDRLRAEGQPIWGAEVRIALVHLVKLGEVERQDAGAQPKRYRVKAAAAEYPGRVCPRCGGDVCSVRLEGRWVNADWPPVGPVVSLNRFIVASDGSYYGPDMSPAQLTFDGFRVAGPGAAILVVEHDCEEQLVRVSRTDVVRIRALPTRGTDATD